MRPAPLPTSPDPVPSRCAELHQLVGSSKPGASQPFAVVTDGATPADTAALAPIAEVERRLAAYGVPVARMLAAARIARSTWTRWRAGGTRRPDRWAAALVMTDRLVVERCAPGFSIAVQDRAAAASPAEPSAAVRLDAEVIDLAARVELLVPREVRLVLHVAGIEDAVMGALPPRPILAEGLLYLTNQLTFEEDGTRVTTIREPAGWNAELRANREAHGAALAEWERLRQAEEVRRSLPRWTKLRERTTARLERWGMQLAAMRPTTQAGLAAKASASVAVAEDDTLPDDWRQTLAVSLSRDAVRILGAEAGLRQRPAADPFVGYCAEIMELQAIIAATDERSPQQNAAWARWRALDTLFLVSRPTTLAGVVAALEVARDEHYRFEIEDTSDDEIGTGARIIQHALASALDVLRPVMVRDGPATAPPRPASLLSVAVDFARVA